MRPRKFVIIIKLNKLIKIKNEPGTANLPKIACNSRTTNFDTRLKNRVTCLPINQ